MLKALVTGGTGFIGKALVSKLMMSPDISIDVLYRNSKQEKICSGNIRYIHIDDFNPSNTTYDVVLHLAAYLTSLRDKTSTIRLIESNLLFPAKLLSEVKIKKGGLFVDTGSFAELHVSPDGLNVNYLYAETKKSFENIGRFFAVVNQYNYCKVYPYTVISKTREGKKLLDIILSSLDAEYPIPMTSGGQVLDFIDRDDVVSLYEALVFESDYSKLNNEKIECCTGAGTSVRDLARMVSKISGRPLNIEWGLKPYREADIMYAVGCPDKAQCLVGWRAKSDLYTTLSKIIE